MKFQHQKQHQKPKNEVTIEVDAWGACTVFLDGAILESGISEARAKVLVRRYKK